MHTPIKGENGRLNHLASSMMYTWSNLGEWKFVYANDFHSIYFFPTKTSLYHPQVY